VIPWFSRLTRAFSRQTWTGVYTSFRPWSGPFLITASGWKRPGSKIAGIANLCVVAGRPEKLAPVRASQGPLIVNDLNQTKALLIAHGATIAEPDAESETGRYFYAVHPDGSEVEYVEWKPELRIRILGF
jgi:hypothetical protein